MWVTCPVGFRQMNRILACGVLTAAAAWAVAAGPAPAWNKRTAPVTAPAPVTWVSTTYRPTELPDPRPLVWVLDGAGDLRGSSTALAQANLMAGTPLELCVFPWSHGYRRMLLDQTDMAHARVQGARLAAAILERQQREPGRRVVLAAHSAGCAVAVAAGDVLPPDSVDRILLLAPSVSTGYDLRPTLRAAREGVDVFCSKKDWVALGFVVRVVGTTDNARSGTAAGRFGFQPKGDRSLDDAEANRLRQHFWSADVAWTGHTGGHHGMHAPAFVHAYLFPLMGVR